MDEVVDLLASETASLGSAILVVCGHYHKAKLT